MHTGWCSSGGIGILQCWLALLFCSLSPDLLIQLLEESNKFLELLADIVR
jgi:hypothetical protein